MEDVYRLKNDIDCIAHMQRRSLDSTEIGLQNTHGLIGSDDWWNQIESGSLTLHVVQGVISGFWGGQWDDGLAEFEMQQNDGIAVRFLCGVEPLVAKSAFHIGRPVEVQYVIQELKTAFNGSHDSKVTIAISIG